MRYIIIYASLLITSGAQAATVAKCVDDAGKVTFSQHGCPTSSVSADTLKVDNSTPSGSSKPTQMAPAQAGNRQSGRVSSRAVQSRTATPTRARSCSRCRFR